MIDAALSRRGRAGPALHADRGHRPAGRPERINLTMPKGDISLQNGTWLMLQAKQGVFIQQQPARPVAGRDPVRDDGTTLVTAAPPSTSRTARPPAPSQCMPRARSARWTRRAVSPCWTKGADHPVRRAGASGAECRTAPDATPAAPASRRRRGRFHQRDGDGADARARGPSDPSPPGRPSMAGRRETLTCATLLVSIAHSAARGRASSSTCRMAGRSAITAATGIEWHQADSRSSRSATPGRCATTSRSRRTG